MARSLLLFWLISCALPAQAGRLLCLGTAPGFMMVIEDTEVAFDYLGDGRFVLEPPLQSAPQGFATHSLVTARDRWPVYLETRSCRVANATLDVSIEIAVPTSDGARPLIGCCLWKPAGE
jgi:hypothetical protein